MSDFSYDRLLIKLSGESLGAEAQPIDFERVQWVAGEVAACCKLGFDIALVIGGGNLFRGRSLQAFDRVTADSMGMLGTVINALALQDACLQAGFTCSVFSALEMGPIVERYSRRRAVECLLDKQVVVFAGGTGSPFFTTDTTAALRAVETGCGVVLKATKVDGVYEEDPAQNPNTRKFSRISFRESILRGLKVMDSAALALCMDNELPVVVFDFFKPGNLLRLLKGEAVGTLISPREGVEYA